MDIRDNRLIKEFEMVRDMTGPHSLIEIRCSDLSIPEAREWLKNKVDNSFVNQKNFLSLEEFASRFPGRVPEKYQITYKCAGRLRDEDGVIVRSEHHVMTVIYGYNYPERPPVFIWHTPIWHPNIKKPYICANGRPFAVGITLRQMILTIGEMIQYRNVNLRDPLNHEAARWVEDNQRQDLVDDRDLLDSRKTVRSLVVLGDEATPTEESAELLVEIVDDE